MTKSQQYQVNFDQEIHCDYCQEISHFHFDDQCPVCHSPHAGTDQYCSVETCIEDDGGVFSCDSCGTKFKIISFDYCEEPEAIIEVVQKSTLPPPVLIPTDGARLTAPIDTPIGISPSI